jgi:hypothetical protein
LKSCLFNNSCRGVVFARNLCFRLLGNPFETASVCISCFLKFRDFTQYIAFLIPCIAFDLSFCFSHARAHALCVILIQLSNFSFRKVCTGPAITLPFDTADSYVRKAVCPPFPIDGAFACVDAFVSSTCKVTCLPGLTLLPAAPFEAVCSGMTFKWSFVNQLRPSCVSQPPVALNVNITLQGGSANRGTLAIAVNNVFDPIVTKMWSSAQTALACQFMGYSTPSVSLSSVFPSLSPYSFFSNASSAASSKTILCSPNGTSANDCIITNTLAIRSDLRVNITCLGSRQHTGGANMYDPRLWESFKGTGGACGGISANNSLYFGAAGDRVAVLRPFTLPANTTATVSFDIWFGVDPLCTLDKIANIAPVLLELIYSQGLGSNRHTIRPPINGQPWTNVQLELRSPIEQHV